MTEFSDDTPASLTKLTETQDLFDLRSMLVSATPVLWFDFLLYTVYQCVDLQQLKNLLQLILFPRLLIFVKAHRHLNCHHYCYPFATYLHYDHRCLLFLFQSQSSIIMVAVENLLLYYSNFAKHFIVFFWYLRFEWSFLFLILIS